MNSTQKKRGRKAKPYLCQWDGKTIDGLYQCPDGRWRITETGTKFTESDPRLAVLRFHRWQARHQGREALIRLADPLLALSEDDGAIEAVLRHELGVGEHRAPSDESLILRIPESADPFSLHRSLPAEAVWAHLRDEIVCRPQYVAQMTGIEQIGYLSDIRKPTASPTLKEVGDLFFARKKFSVEWKRKCEAFWKEFVDYVEVSNLRDVTQDKLLGYSDMLAQASLECGRQPTYIRQRFDAIKSIINYPPKRGKWAEDSKEAYSLCAVLVKPVSSTPDPRPIDRDDFQTLLASADEPLKALLLTALNCCMYGSEVAALDWSEVDLRKGTVVTRRQKTGVVRVAVLWPRTVEALSKLEKLTTGAVFVTASTGVKLTYQTVYKAFSALREATALRSVQICHLRDGAYTAACEAEGVASHQAEILGRSSDRPERSLRPTPPKDGESCVRGDRGGVFRVRN